MKIQLRAAATALALGAWIFAADAQTTEVGTEPGAPLLARANLPARAPATLTVTSPAFKAGGDIPFENTQYRGNVFPGLAWTKGPYGARSYVIIMQDPDSLYKSAPILHWTMFNIPATTRRLEVGATTPPTGASNGPNIRGPGHAYMGPHTPPGPKHHYHFQVFALDSVLPPEAGADYVALTTAMQDHVLASGELVGLAQADPNAPPRPPAPPHT